MHREVATATAAKSLQSYPTLCDPIDGSPPGSHVPGILQARTLEWGAIAFSDDLYYVILNTKKIKMKSIKLLNLAKELGERNIKTYKIKNCARIFFN